MISIDSIEGGEVLAESVMNEQENVLIPAGTVLKEDYAPLMKSFGIMTLKVEDPYERYQMPNPIIHPARRTVLIDWVRKLMENHIYRSGSTLKEFEIIANEIVKEINAVSEDAVIDMTQRSANLYEHTVMVTLLSVMVAKKLNIDRERQFDMAIGCLLHDIGLRYVTVPYENTDMENAEQKIVFEYKKHTIFGYTAIEDETWVPPIARKMVLTHHEKSDGSGFPMHQRVKEIECRILQACDAFDCMISGMECRQTSVQEAFEIISKQAGTFYSKNVVDTLISLVAKYPVGTTVQISDDEQGLVISQTKNSEKPIVMVIHTEEEEHNGRRYNLMLDHQISIL
jgi:HD-GYP domain-containing protein (c-di-GMP phosphodiesterase class II)